VNSELIASSNDERTFVLVFDTNDEVCAGLLAFAQEQCLKGSRFTAIGALANAVLGYFDWQSKSYLRIPCDEQVEVASLSGDIALNGKIPVVHAHAVVGRRDGSTLAGHLLEAHVRPTLEVILVESPTYLCRKSDAVSGLALIDVKRTDVIHDSSNT